jgi:hypothetical protein
MPGADWFSRCAHVGIMGRSSGCVANDDLGVHAIEPLANRDRAGDVSNRDVLCCDALECFCDAYGTKLPISNVRTTVAKGREADIVWIWRKCCD